MTFTDKEAIKLLNRVRFPELEESIEECPENERDGRTDLQVLADEAEYFFDMYSEDTIFRDDLAEARQWMRETKNGKVFSGLVLSAQLARYHNRTDQARESINSYNRLKSLVKRLNAMT